MRRILAIALAAVVAVTPGFAEDKKDEKKELTGTFKRKANELDLKMTFKKGGILVYAVSVGEAGCVMDCKYTKEKDGTFKCEITKFETKGDFPVKKDKGYQFSFKFEVKDGKGKMTDFMGADVDDNAKAAIEGEYDGAGD